MSLKQDTNRGDGEYILNLRLKKDRSERERELIEYLLKLQDENEVSAGSATGAMRETLIGMHRTIVGMGRDVKVGNPIDAIRHEMESKFERLESMLNGSFQHVDTRFNDVEQSLANVQFVSGDSVVATGTEADDEGYDDAYLDILMDDFDE